MSSRSPGRRKKEESDTDSRAGEAGGVENDAALIEEAAIGKALDDRLEAAPVDRMRKRLSKAKQRSRSKKILHKAE